MPFVTLLGFAVGSFLNVVIDRLPAGESVVRGASHCPRCGHRLSARDLVPFLNYFWLRGRCRYCHAPISPRLPLVEAGTGVLFAVTGYRFGATPLTAVLLVYLCLFIVVFFIDLEQGLILDKVIYPGMVLAFLAFPFGPGGQGRELPEALTRSLLGGAFGFTLMLLIYLAARGGMGGGDVKLAGLVGLATGFPQVVMALLLAFLIGGVVSGALLLFRIRRRKDFIPFGPFLATTALLALYIRWVPPG